MHVTTTAFAPTQRTATTRHDFTEYLSNQGIATVPPLHLSPTMRRWMLWKPQHPNSIVFIVDENGRAHSYGADAVKYARKTAQKAVDYKVRGQEIPAMNTPAIEAIVLAVALKEEGITVEFIY